MCGESGVVYDFVIYQGKNTEIDKENKEVFGLGASVALHLANSVPPGSELYFDNFFSSYHLFQMLTKKSAFAASTVRVDRFVKPPFMTTKELKDRGHRAMQEVTSQDRAVTLVRWNDNQPVTLASNFVGIGKTETVIRWDKDRKAFVEVSRPDVVGLYNKSMGGVDKIDFLVVIYRTFIRSRKWPLRIIFHLIDLAICNSWLEYRKDCETCNVRKNMVMDLLQFRMSVVYSLGLVGSTNSARKRGRPKLQDEEMPSTPPPAPSARCESRPIAAVRLDTVDNFPIHSNKKEAGRCKKPQCKGKSHIRCDKCEVYLCLSKDRNCFRSFHMT
ncbi:piggyBac transposable element-derived protein 3-like [Macrosteles quadrilineatus]|uniref:piggyBac transposable element-derived protein 3-like n=1 Tax=Macrosteles quadrilineatus TaxID=74068 RepID=UPI0023E2D191|nr:piggyBac transposable element-derived protein 3-like [Macrosteles quadrilineatus]